MPIAPKKKSADALNKPHSHPPAGGDLVAGELDVTHGADGNILPPLFGVDNQQQQSLAAGAAAAAVPIMHRWSERLTEVEDLIQATSTMHKASADGLRDAVEVEARLLHDFNLLVNPNLSFLLGGGGAGTGTGGTAGVGTAGIPLPATNAEGGGTGGDNVSSTLTQQQINALVHLLTNSASIGQNPHRNPLAITQQQQRNNAASPPSDVMGNDVAAGNAVTFAEGGGFTPQPSPSYPYNYACTPLPHNFYNFIPHMSLESMQQGGGCGWRE